MARLKYINNKTKKIIIACISCSILSGAMYYTENVRIPNKVREAVRETRRLYSIEDTPSIKATRAISKISKGQFIGSGDIESVDVPQYIYYGKVKLTPWGSGSKSEDFVGKISNKNLKIGDILSIEEAMSEIDIISDFDRLTEIPLDRVVANTLKEGQLVDIVYVHAGLEEIVLSKKRVKELKFPVEGDSEQISYLGNIYNKPYALMYLDEVERAKIAEVVNLVEEEELGRIEVIVYESEEQTKSRVEFGEMEIEEVVEEAEENGEENVVTD